MARLTHASRTRRRTTPSVTAHHPPTAAADGLVPHGIRHPGHAFWDLGVPALYEEALRRREGQLADREPTCVCEDRPTLWAEQAQDGGHGGDVNGRDIRGRAQ